jgi:hypothetical protein
MLHAPVQAISTCGRVGSVGRMGYRIDICKRYTSTIRQQGQFWPSGWYPPSNTLLELL